MNKRKFGSMFWQVSAIFIIVLIVFAGFTLYISVNAARNYSIEVNQKLNRNLARNTVDVIKDVFHDGQVNKEALADIMHSMMVINPSVEVYLLDPQGKILSYVAPEKVVKLDSVSLSPVRHFLSDSGQNIIYGDDPRNPGDKKIFSVARVTEKGELTGYVYIVLASQEYVSVAQAVLGSYILGLSIRSIIVILIISSVLGLVAIWYITSKLNTIIHGMQLFQSGKFDSRIAIDNKNELDKIGLVFNEMATTIENNIKELKGIDELRKELIGNVSHDLRTPVASIQGYAETLLLKEENIKPEERKKFTEIIYKSAQRLKKLVDELFELSKLQSNQIKIKTEPFSITELVSDVANKYRMISQNKGISINTFITKDIPVVEADISLIDRVLQNLIDNAIRFCRKDDYINIEIKLSDPDKVNVTIADSGEGIGQDELPHIFERYYKGKRYSESTGLGLAIVKKIIELHHSEIVVQSNPGNGTIFTFSLPVARIA